MCRLGGERGCGVILNMEDAMKEGGVWSYEWVPRNLVAYLLASHSVHLGCECEGHKCCGLEVGLCGDKTSLSCKSMMSDFYPVYSPGRRSKNCAATIM